MLFREVKPGDTLRIGDTVITIEAKTGQRTRVGIESPHKVEHDKGQPRPAMQPAAPSPRPPAPPPAAATPAPAARQPFLRAVAR